MELRRRSVIVLGLVLFTLIASSIVIGIILYQQNQAAEDAKADSPADNCCFESDYNNGRPGGACSADGDWVAGFNACKDKQCGKCNTGGSGGVTAYCPNEPGVAAVWCAVFDCPQGDTNADGQCTASDQGVVLNTYNNAATCPTTPPSGCGQVDFYRAGTPGQSWDQYCGYTFLSFSGSCSQTPPPVVPPVEPPVNPPPPEEPEQACGDSTCDTGELCELGTGNVSRACRATDIGSAPGGPEVQCVFTGAQACLQQPANAEIDVRKSSSISCDVQGNNTIVYTISIRNSGDQPLTVSSIIDRIESIQLPSISLASGTPTIDGNRINWPGTQIAAGVTISLTYTLTITPAEAVRLGLTSVTNSVVVTYDPEDQLQAGAENTIFLTCSAGELPETSLEDWSIIGVALICFALAIVVYRRGIGVKTVDLMLTSIGDGLIRISDSPVISSKPGAKTFERRAVDDGSQ